MSTERLTADVERAPDQCPMCGEEFADPDDVNRERGIHASSLDANQLYRRHRRRHFSVFDQPKLDPTDDPHLDAYYDEAPDPTDDEDDEDGDDELDTYTVTKHYSARLAIEVEARDERHAKDVFEQVKADENLEPDVDEHLHTEVSDW
ncbi:hypothetical protein [Halosegnis longus]|uniref:hypothetical protein n=1 Tax=Halosegnis longus TaxID=2216012 RepID=UPI00129DCC53|nr:hypothetical protein [Halosegnis longus]